MSNKCKYVLQADAGDDESEHFIDFAVGPTLAGLLHVAATDPDIWPAPLQIIDTEAGTIVALKLGANPWDVDYSGLSVYHPPIDYTGFARALLD